VWRSKDDLETEDEGQEENEEIEFKGDQFTQCDVETGYVHLCDAEQFGGHHDQHPRHCKKDGQMTVISYAP
jgi:hypothetical protein